MERKEQTLEKRLLRAQRGPKDQEEVRQLVKRGESITVERLGVLGKALLERDLIRPPKDSRVRIQIARAGLEAGGLIGSAATAELHLHQHTTLPPVVQAMLLSKMAEISGKSIDELSAPVIEATPPDPLPGEPRNE